jgi:microcystin-dependent protein
MCKNKNCNGSCPKCSGNNQNDNIIAQLQSQVEALTESIKPFICGHPILLIESDSDIAQFDTDGYGVGCWEGWAICNGQAYMNPQTKVNFTTPNFTDRFIVQAGGSYSVGDTGGLDTVALTVNELPVHTHGITDNGHTHNLTDTGHNHPVDDPGHDHAGSGGSHTHTFTTNTIGGHEHSTGVIGITDGGGGTGANVRTSSAASGNSTSTDGAHSHSGTTDPASAAVTVNSSFTGVQTQNAFIGITETDSNTTEITVDDAGSGDAHENRPPYFAALYVIKMW